MECFNCFEAAQVRLLKSRGRHDFHCCSCGARWAAHPAEVLRFEFPRRRRQLVQAIAWQRWALRINPDRPETRAALARDWQALKDLRLQLRELKAQPMEVFAA